MLYTTLTGFHATGSPVFDEYARWQIRRMLALLRHRHGQLTSWRSHRSREADPQHDPDTGQPIYFTRVQSWMEAQGPLVLHEAYKTYGDERILDGLWAQADYFAHHVVYFPELGMLNNRTSMPNKLMGRGTNKAASINLRRHDRHVQAWPLLYHYTGWNDVRERYARFERARKGEWVRDWFLQTGKWERLLVPKATDQPPEPITDLRVTKIGSEGIALEWTSPADDGPSGHAERYFVKYSDKPIVEFAPTDNPARRSTMARIVKEAEDLIRARTKGKKRISRRDLTIKPGEVEREPKGTRRWHPDWHKVSAFWMAEHIAGEPPPSPAGIRETFTVRELRPHEWFGAPRQPTVADLPSGTYYLAVCTWDADRNLSRISNVVQVDLP